ncbi:CYTH and CHAD domain-containing protein [Arthrobacter sp. CDRTa11]|uniref:CYTH and CHAD domain-containing protein n=1 Tax=Arthrobacter sp. CDRTa11 TaxID=2651199 RepID=UPI002265F315|nr:CYTH and CHAD domain-containing protein [Arthrobacter sp. CDRTa11]
MALQGVEIEKKYEVGEEAVVPPLAGLPGVARVGDPHVAALEAVYFDTESYVLASRRITLRRRTGGADAGWHLKLPPESPGGDRGAAGSDSGGSAAGPGSDAGSEPQQRRELHAPLGQPGVVPDALLAHLQAYLRGAELVPVARLETQRTTHALYDADGVHLADLADDKVHAQPLLRPKPAGVEPAREEPEAEDPDGEEPKGDGQAGDRSQHWREWELELVHGSSDIFAAAEEVLAAAGARPAGHGSKLARALQDTIRETRGREPQASEPDKKSPASAVVTAYLGAQIREILAHDSGVRLEEPEAVHNLRAATRRARSALAAYRRHYSAVAVRRLQEELKWLGRTLGVPRDAEVMLERLRGHLAELPEGPAATAVKDRVEQELGGTFDDGYRKVMDVLASERYFRLLDDLEAFRDSPPLRPEGAVSGRKVGGKLVAKAVKRLRRSQKAAKGARRGAQHESALHQVRKDAKRLRHVAESLGPVSGKRAAKVAKAAHRQQKILGEFRDSILARDLLGKLGGVPDLPEPVASLFVELRTRQVELAADAESKYRKARKKSQKRLKAGVH